MAKATQAPASKERGSKPTRGGSGRDGGRPAARTTTGGGDSGGGGSGGGNYFGQVVAELRKVTWPTMPDLARMTQVVIATVILFAALIGGFDFVLGYIAKPLYTQQGTTAPTLAPSLAVPTLIPQTTSPSPGASASPGASPAASASANPSATP